MVALGSGLAHVRRAGRLLGSSALARPVWASSSTLEEAITQVHPVNRYVYNK